MDCYVSVGPWCSMVQRVRAVRSAAATSIPRTGWTVSVDSFQVGYEAEKMLDGDPKSFWHTQWTLSNMLLPHKVTIDMKRVFVVNGFSYLPRQDGQNNGNIGQHKLELSIDGNDWGEPVASGMYLNDSSQKTTLFTPQPGRYVRFTAMSEAQDTGNQWMSAAEVNILSPDPSFSGSDFTSQPADKGKWGPSVNFPVVPVAAAMINDTNLLMWSAFRPDTFGGETGITFTATWDLSTGTVSQRVVNDTHHDMFCPGLSLDHLGQPVVTGGSSSLRTSIYNTGTDRWIAASNMQIARGYQSQVTLSNGQIFTIGGSWSGGQGDKAGEVYDVANNIWTRLPGCKVEPMLTKDSQGVYRQDNHGWLFAWKQKYVFQAGPSSAMNWYNVDGTGSQQDAGLRGSDPDSMNGNAVMYDALQGKILTVGGGPNYQDSEATNSAHIITLGNPGDTANVRQISPMAYARGFANSVIVPDGKVLILGGQSYVVPFTDTNAIMVPELWDPETEMFVAMNPMAVPRTYHSIGLLLPDATVLSGGGGLCGTNCATNHFDAQIFLPPYLFKADGSLAPRPQITSTPGTVKVGDSITVQTDVEVADFALIRYGSNTHSVNTDQRRISLKPRVTNKISYTLDLPSDPGVVIPGYWMLFAITSEGVPSVARTVHIQL
ncbi:galactose oxidase [Aspergillus caelatus]|uniref:Galactose oxidase n=1 Tax=Aspergillus caelatus TaxID=61420 RepID=A0A5N6ZUN6_9EURO|nr:galactose oxidase [Aspergillus caelatus]KAE8361334.1 galactose oxidase [Aspergillus caelatus]